MKGRFGRVLVGVLASMMVLLAACSTTPTEKKEPAATTPAQTQQPAPAVEKEIKVLYVGDQFWLDQAQEFTKATGIKVKYESAPFPSLREKYLAGFMARSSDVDVIHVRDDWMAEFASKGFLEPLDARIDKPMRDRFSPQSWINLSWGEKVYGVPRYLWLWQFYYNTELLAKAGATQPPATWDELAALAAKVTGGGIFGYAEAWGPTFATTPFIVHLRAHGGDFWDYKTDKPAFNSPQGVAALQAMYDLTAKHKVMHPAALDTNATGPLAELFMQGNLAFMMNTPHVFFLAEDPKQSKVVGKVAVGLIPGVTNGRKTASYAETAGVAIPVFSQKKDLAWEYVKFVTSAEQQKKMGMAVGRIPADLKMLADGEILKKMPHVKSVAEQIQYPYGMFRHPKATAITDTVAREIQQALSGKKSPAQALKDAADAAAKVASAP